MSNCQLCEELRIRRGPGMICGRCSNEKYGKENVRPKPKSATQKRADRIRKFFSNAPDTPVKKLSLSCPNKHHWISEYNPGGYEENKAITPLCPQCSSGFVQERWLRVEITDKKCTNWCKKAVGDLCRCSCAGANHGTISPLSETSPDDDFDGHPCSA